MQRVLIIAALVVLVCVVVYRARPQEEPGSAPATAARPAETLIRTVLTTRNARDWMRLELAQHPGPPKWIARHAAE